MGSIVMTWSNCEGEGTSGSSVGLVAADSERQADVAEVFRDVIVKGFGFIEICVQALGEFLRFGADFGTGSAAVFFKVGVPAADLLPGFEGCHLHVGTLVFGTAFLFLLVFVLIFILGVVFALQMRSRPVIDAAAVGFGDGGIHPGLAL